MKSILVVEDEVKIRKMYKKLLTEEGFKVLETSNAVDAYEILGKKKVDLVVLDIRMPEIEGNVLYQILNLFHKKNKVLVASVYPVEVQKRLIPDAADYYDKSHGLALLLEKIKKILG